MADLIDRSKLVDYIMESYPDWCVKPVRPIFDFINGMPSAEPEIIRCKDCKHWMPYDWMFSEIWRSVSMDDYSDDEIGCAYCDMNMHANDFCSRAERKNDE